LQCQTSVGLQNFVSNPGVHAIDAHIKTPYTENFNLSVQHAINNNLAATLSYVGNVSRHLSLYYDPNTIRGLFAPGVSTQQFNPFPDLSGIGTIHFGGVSDYNSLQAKLEQRLSHGLSFLATYTYAHALDDSSDAGGLSSAVGDRNMALIPYTEEYTNSPYDIRHRVTVNANYKLPFGKGQAYLNSSKWADEAIGGWSSSLTFAAQTGTPFTVYPSISTANGGSARAILTRDPFAAGGSPDPTNTQNLQSCPTKTKTRANWYNPCAFANPLPGNLITGTNVVTDEKTAIAYLGGRSNSDLRSGILRREYVALQELRDLPRAVPAIPRGCVQPVESSDTCQSFKPGDWTARRADHQREVLPEQHARWTVPSTLTEVRFLSRWDEGSVAAKPAADLASLRSDVHKRG
jgi:hypothetical protein